VIATDDDSLPEGLRTVDEALHRSRFRQFRILPFLGPAFIACVAYIDPGNFATNIAGGSRFGYRLVWVIVAANLLAMLIQTLSAKLGIATRQNLPEVCRARLPRRATWFLWGQAEAIAMATDLAEFLGAAIGIHLLTGMALFPAAVIAGVAAFAILELLRFGARPLEAVIAVLVGVIGVCYVIELGFANPDYHQVLKHAIVPQFGGNEAVLLAVGILGATVMPHVIYLHSALTQDRIVPESDEDEKTLLRYTRIDVLIAMTIAGLINVAMLVMAASTFFKSGRTHVDSLEGAQDARAAARRGIECAIRTRVDRVGTLELRDRHARGPGRDAGIHPPPDPGRLSSPGDDASRVRRHRPRRRRVADARHLAGRALVRHPVRADPARLLHRAQGRDGRPRQPEGDDGRGEPRRDGDRLSQHLLARPDPHLVKKKTGASGGGARSSGDDPVAGRARAHPRTAYNR
jgi:hypothetical protein